MGFDKGLPTDVMLGKGRAMIPSGSLVPGVDSSAFGLPDHTAYRYEVPDPAVADYVSAYEVFDSDWPRVDGSWAVILPSWPTIRISLADRPMSVRLGDQFYDPMPRAALYGTTTRAMEVTPYGEVTVSLNLTPLGWARLFDIPASKVRDRIIPLADVMDPAVVDALVAELRGSDQALDVKGILDRFVATNMGPVHADEPEIRKLLQLINSPETQDLSETALRFNISPSRLSRLSNRHFGYPPKRLLMRSRFMRSFMPMFAGERRSDFSLIDDSYVDVSHFLRDARRFLGTTPTRFMARPTPYIDAVVRARRLVRYAHRNPALWAKSDDIPSTAAD